VKVEVFWAVTPHSVVVGDQRFKGLCCLHHTTTLHGVTTLRRPWFERTNLVTCQTLYITRSDRSQSVVCVCSDRKQGTE